MPTDEPMESPSLSPQPPASPNVAKGWDFFPLIVCINLKERDDRLEEVKEEFRKVGLDRVLYFRTRRRKDRDHAIIDSHMACLKLAIERDVPYVLVFEDDVQFTPGYESHLARVIEFLESRDDWNLFHLGAFIFRKKEYVTPHIVRGGMLTAHAYIVRTEYAKKILAERPFCSGMSVDLFYTVLNGNDSLVHVDPLMCTQRPSESDGTWDSGAKNQAGWLGEAMVFTSLRFGEKLRFNRLSWLERLKIRNGMTFFIVFRMFLRRKLAKARALGVPVETEKMEGEFVTPEMPGSGEGGAA